VHYYQLDLSDFSAIESTAEQIRLDHGNPSVLINNAGIGTRFYAQAFRKFSLTHNFFSYWHTRYQQ